MNEQGNPRCRVCNQQYPAIYLGSSGVCCECRWAAYLPSWYKRAEKYEFVEQFGHANATRTPRTGIDWLDESHLRVCDLLMMGTKKPQASGGA